MKAVREYLTGLGLALLTILAVVVVAGVPAIGFFAVAFYFADNPLIAWVAGAVGRVLLVATVLVVTFLLFAGLLGLRMTARLFFVHDKRAIAAREELRARFQAEVDAAATVPVAPGQGVLRLIPVRPEWWHDPAFGEETTAVVTVGGTEHPLATWEPLDVAVSTGDTAVVAWLERRDGGGGRRVSHTVTVPVGGIATLVYRPSSLPELAGKLEPLDHEPLGDISMFRLLLGAVALIATTYAVWQLATG